jgi:ribosomal protein S18 acetylase RimI-like enzyme
MTDAELSARMRDNIVAFKRLQVATSPVRQLALPGVTAFALPSNPSAVYQQLVLYETAGALATALDALEAFFREHAAHGWRISVPQADTETARLLAQRGYRASEVIPVMGLSLAEAPPTPPTLALERPSTLRELLTLNEAVFDDPIEHLRAWHALVPPALHALQVREAGQVIAGALALDAGDTAGVYLVATARSARRRGLASEVMRGMLAEARARGRAAAVLQSTPEGHGLYARVGFRDVDRWTDWVRRVA